MTHPEQSRALQIVPPRSKATSPNPKDIIGNTKVSMSKLPAVACAWGAMAMMDGAAKYGAYNFRDIPVSAHIYVDAAKRHLDLWFEGQEMASDSKVHHLGHALACCAILMDAQECGTLIDDRPLQRDGNGNAIEPDWYEDFLARLSGIIKEKANGKGTESKGSKEGTEEGL